MRPDSANPPGEPDPAPSRRLANTVIAADVECRGCRYNLQGLPGSGRCPECGLEVAQTIQSIIDPQASRLPRLSAPRAVGNSMVMLVASAMLAAFAVVGQTIAARAGAGATIVAALPLCSALLAAVGLVAVFRLRPPRGREPGGAVWRDIRLLVLGCAGWALLAGGLWWRQETSVTLGFPTRVNQLDRPTIVLHLGLVLSAILWMRGVGEVFGTIGHRSLAYRRSRAGRQRAYSMIAALAGVGLGEAIRLVTAHWMIRADPYAAALGIDNLAVTTGTVLVWVCSLMIMIGLAYMLMNALWIRRDLLRPPPALEQLILPEMPGEGEGEGGSDSATPRLRD